jgi:hypothetical protein
MSFQTAYIAEEEFHAENDFGLFVSMGKAFRGEPVPQDPTTNQPANVCAALQRICCRASPKRGGAPRMKLLFIELFGADKGLRDQTFDWSSTDGNVAVFFGANSSGKSQVMELMAEVFAYLERERRSDFRVSDGLGYDFRVG